MVFSFLDVNLSGEDREDIGGILFAREIRERFEYTFTPIVMVTAIGNMEMQAYREAALLPVHYEAISQGAGGRGCSEGAGKREQGETTGDRCEKRRDQLSAEMRGYPLSGSDTERNKTASCDGELGCPLCDSQTDACLRCQKGCLRSAIGCMRSIKMKLNITIPSTGSSGSKIVRIR